MTTAFDVSKRQRRASLLCGAAIGLLAAAPGWAQTLPVPTVGGSGGAAITNPTTSSVDVDLLGTNRLIKWDSFNLGSSASSSETVNFRDSTAVSGPLAAFNLISSAGGASQIFGKITSASNISVWLSNPSGIVFGQTGAFSGGSLVLTTAAFSSTDRAKFNATTGPLTGTLGLNAMPAGVGVTVSGTTANGGTTGLNVTGNLIIAAQVVDVKGTVTASGDVALVAARSVDVPADLGSNISVTINEGTTLGSLSVGANGKINAGRILAGGAANLATNLLLGIDPGATLTASAANGKVIIAAGTTSAETLVGSATRAITVASTAATAGTANVTHNGAILAGSEARIDANGAIAGTATGGSVTGGSVALTSSGGAVSYAGSLSGATGVAVTSGGTGNVTLSGAVTASGAGGAGAVTITSANAATLGDAATARALRADGAVSITALNGSIGTLGDYTIQSGLGTDKTSGITLDQRTTGAINLGGSTVRAGTEATPGDGIFQGAFTVANTTGTVTLGTVDAASIMLPVALPADVIAGRITTRDDLTLNVATGSIRVDTAQSLTGNVRLIATTGAVSGQAIAPAGDGRLLDTFGRTTVGALTDGKAITVTAGQDAQLAALVAGTEPGAAATGVDQVTVGARAIDLLTANAASGNIGLTATGAGTVGTVRGTSLTATLGSVTVSAAGAITGQTAPTAVSAGIRAGLAKARDLLSVDAAGNARLGTLDATDALEIKANGSVTGLAQADVAAGPGLAITAGTTVTVGTTATRPMRVALGAVTAGDAVNIFGTSVSAQTIDTIGGVAIDATTGLAVDAIGGTTRASSISLKQTTALAAGHATEDTGATLFATGDTLSPAFGGATLTAGGPLRLFAGGTFAGGTFAGTAAPAGTLAIETVGLGQIASATGSAVTMSGRALTIGTVISTVGAVDLIATAGGLYLGTGPSSAKTTATFQKMGATGPLDEDEIRLRAAFAAGGKVTVTSATDVRGVALTSNTDSIDVTANRSVTGLKRSTDATDGRLDVGHERIALTATGATGAAVTVAATTGTAQLGTVQAGAAGGAPSGIAQIHVTGVGVDVSNATTLKGNLILMAGASGLRLGTGIVAEGVVDAVGAAGVTSDADAQIGSLTAQNGDLLLRVDGTLSGLLATGIAPPAIAGGLTLGSSSISGVLTLGGSGDVAYGSGSVGSAVITSPGNVRIGSLTATDNVTVTATGSVTGLSTSGIASAAAGANLTASGSILLPAPTSAPGGVAAVLGIVNAGQEVAIKAGAVSARSITAGTGADVQASTGAIIDAISAASGSINVSGAVPSTDTSELTVDPTGALRSAFGFANIATADAKFIHVTATTGAAQLGTIVAGTTATPDVSLGGTVGQIIVDAQAITAQRAFANNGSLKLTARAGDLYLGTPADGVSALAQVAGAGDRALLDKQGSAGLVTINGQLTAGGSNVALVADDDGVALVTSTTDIRGRKVVSNTGDVRLRAVGRVDALLSGTAASPGVTLGTSSGSTVTGLASVGGTATIIGGDVRIGSLTSATAINLSASGSVTGLAPDTVGAGIARPFDISAARDVTVGALAPAPVLGSATLGRVQAGRDLSVTANNVSIANANTGGGATLASTSGLFVGTLTTGGDAMLTDTAAGGVPLTTFVPDDTAVGNEALAPGFGFADLTLNNAGAPGAGAAGTIIVNAGNIAQLGAVTAGLGSAPLTDALGAARDQIRVTAQGITATSATSLNGGITLRATQGGLYADTVSAGTYATLRKLGGVTGGGNEIRVRTVTGGTTGAIGANRGEIVLSSNTDARIGIATSITASIDVTATRDVTGLLRAVAASGVDGQTLPAFGAANLSAPGVPLAAIALASSEPMQRITVSAGGVAKLGTIDAGRGTTVAAPGVTMPQIGVTAVALDVDSATTRNGDLALNTTTGRLRLGTGLVARAATLKAGTVVGTVTDAEIGSLTAGTDILVNASGQVTGLKAVGNVVTIADGLRIGTIDAGGPDTGGVLRSGTVTVSGAGNVRLGDVTATGALGVTALGGSVTGLAGAVTIPAPAVTLLQAGGNVRVEALAGSPRLDTAAITEIRAGGNASVNATRIAAGTTTAGANVTFIAGTALAASRITGATSVAGTVTATTDAAGTDTVDNAVIASATPVLAAGFGAANLTARNAAGITGTITVNAANVVQLGTVRAGVGSDGLTGIPALPTAGLFTNSGGVAPQVLITAKAISIGTLLAFNGGMDLLASSGDLWLETGDAGGYARLRKTGTAGAVILGTLTSGTQPTSAAPILAADRNGASLNFYGGTALVDSTTIVRGNTIRSLTGDVLVRAVTAITGRTPIATGVVGDFTIGDVVASGDVTLNSGGNMRLSDAMVTIGGVTRPGAISSSGNIVATAQGSITGTNGPSGASGINLLAARGVDVDRSRNGVGPLALAALGTVSAGAPARLEDGTTIAQTVRVQAGQISAGSISAPSGAVSLQAVTALNVGTISATTLDARTTSSNGEFDNGVAGVVDNGNANLATRFAGDTLANTYGNARLLADNAKALTVTAGVLGVAGGVAQLGPIKGGTVKVTANAITIRGSSAATDNVSAKSLGALELTSRSGALYLESGTAAGAATLRKGGTADEMLVGGLPINETRIGTLTAATVDANSVTNIRAGTITATGTLGATPPPAELSLVAQNGAVTGLGLAGAATDGRLDLGFDRAILNATAANARISVNAATRAQLGPVTAGNGGTAATAFDQVVVTARDIDAATLRPDVSVVDANTTFLQSVTAANGNIVLAATNTLRLGKGSAAIGASLTAGGRIEIGSATASSRDLLVTSTAGNVSGLKLLTPDATDGRTLLSYDRANLTAAAAGSRVVVMAGPDSSASTTVAQLGNVSAGTGTAFTATLDQIDIRAGKIDLGTQAGQLATASNGNVKLRAVGGRARLGVTTAANNVSIDSAGDVDVLGKVTAGAAGTITITNTGVNKSEVGASATAIGTNQSDAISAFSLTEAEVNLLAAPKVVIDAKGTALTISKLAVAPTTPANTSLALLGTGAITITGPVSTAAAAGRTLQIGGLPTGGSVSNGVVVPANVAASITANLDTGAGIAWAGGTVDLQANKIVFGDALLRTAAPGSSTAAAISLLVSNPQSALYRGSLSGKTYLTAATLKVTYGNYALFQNSGANSAVTGGVALGAQATPSTTALRLASSGDTASNAFAMFGSINGFISTTAALQPQPVIDFSTGSPGNVRVTLANSRINGCPIGSAGAGCLASTPSLPPLSLFDERQVQLFRTDDNPDIQFESLIGTNNEGLIGDLATGAASGDPAGCPTGKEASCPKSNEVKP